ncbi:MAG: CpsD/CapB family tyrosine-protein kinase [Oscillospiraceae bacterium]|jgi:capsular exopolysaccharide synthesis family protein|nr:CpsD/CapB family tyrosine-protein kinase [Oscillospiraceae bacterium]
MKSADITELPKMDYPCTEALNTLCTNLSFSGFNVKSVMLTSCRSGEGKSFLTLNLMRALAGLGKSVVMIDADMRRSMLISRYGIRTAHKPMGLAQYLASQCECEDVLYQTNIPNAHMIFHGHEVANTLALLNTPRLPQLIQYLERNFDVVLIDSPPIGLIIDSAEIAKYVDGTVFVVTNNTIARRELLEAKNQIAKTGCPILGVVLNKVTFDTHSAKKHYYRTYYSHYSSGYYEKKSAANE